VGSAVDVVASAATVVVTVEATVVLLARDPLPLTLSLK
jgi:hypothetical protein